MYIQTMSTGRALLKILSFLKNVQKCFTMLYYAYGNHVATHAGMVE